MMAKATDAEPNDDELYHEFEHTGDVGIAITAPSRNELFRRAAIALAAVMVDRSTIASREKRRVEVRAADDVELMHDMLAALLDLFVVEGFIWREASIEETTTGLDAVLHGEPFSPDRHGFRGEVKAITYHQLTVEQSSSGWHARIILDV
jgi:SHS2 domain-containing protein